MNLKLIFLTINIKKFDSIAIEFEQEKGSDHINNWLWTVPFDTLLEEKDSKKGNWHHTSLELDSDMSALPLKYLSMASRYSSSSFIFFVENCGETSSRLLSRSKVVIS
jgi:hypothetical protein